VEAVGVRNNGRYTTEVFTQHDLLCGEHSCSKVVERFFGGHICPEWLFTQESSTQFINAGASDEPPVWRYLFIIAYNKNFLGANNGRQRPKVALRCFVNNNEIKRANIGRDTFR